MIHLSDLWLSVLDKTNFTVIALTACFVLYTQSADAVYFALGSVFCSLGAKLIKKILRQPRPSNLPGRKAKSTYGMPSTHSAAMSYVATFILLASIYLPIYPSFQPGRYFRILPSLISIPWAVAVMMSRVWLGHHTWPQVIVGVLFGIAHASIWHVLWMNGLNNLGKEVEELFDAWGSAYRS